VLLGWRPARVGRRGRVCQVTEQAGRLSLGAGRAQTVLKDLQAAMKLARTKEAASLPRRPPASGGAAAAAASGAAQDALERGRAAEGGGERQALLQARSRAGRISSPHAKYLCQHRVRLMYVPVER